MGKTSFIRSLLGRDFPGIRIGPEPTTDRFLAVMAGDGGVDRAARGGAGISRPVDGHPSARVGDRLSMWDGASSTRVEELDGASARVEETDSPDARRNIVPQVPGNALAMRYDKPFAGLQGFGNAFLEKLQGAEVCGSAILDNAARGAKRIAHY